MKLYFVTGNIGKLKEVKGILSGFDIEQISVDVPELQGEPEEIAKEKARIACEKTGKAIFVEDTSLSFNCLNGLPGPYIKDFLKKLGIDGLYKLASHYEDTSAYAQVVVGYCEPGKEPIVFKGKINGKIVSPRGSSGFQFDHIFMPDGFDRTFSQMTTEEKNQFSHRKLAMEEFRRWLVSNN